MVSYYSHSLLFSCITFGISKAEGEGEEVEPVRPMRAVALVVVGVGALVLGGKLTVDAGDPGVLGRH